MAKRNQMKILLAFHWILTKRRYNLLKFAQEIMKEMDIVSFVCTDVNCSLAIRFKNGTVKYFNSEYQFRSLLKDN